VMGKLADRYGRKLIYLFSIFLFGLGSLFCGLSQATGSFSLLLIARSIQAIGGGGILPVATAEFGTTFPPEKRGLALGLVGGVFGIANVFGASAGSAILDIFGQYNWQFIFYINLPISLFIIIAGLFALQNTKTESTSKIDSLGITILSVMVLALLYGLKNIDFFNLGSTIARTDVYPFLILFVVFIPLFILIEKKAQDPVINLKYFTDKNIVLTLALSFLTGFIMMGIIFAPQFCENALKIKTGSGGYLIMILGLFAGIGAPISGRLIDRFGVKIILAAGFTATIISSLFLIFVTTRAPSFFTVFVGLMFIGIGIGFTMGTPLNYMMLANTDEKESNSSLAVLSLLRSIGMSVAPAVMVAFIAHAGASVQTNISAILPAEIDIPLIAYAQEIADELDKIKADPNLKDKMGGFDFPDRTALSTVKINMDDSSTDAIPEESLELMKSSDVTTITENTKIMAAAMFDRMTPGIIDRIQSGIATGIDGIDRSMSQMTDTKHQLVTIEELINKMIAAKDSVPAVFETAKNNYLKEIDRKSDDLEKTFQDTMNKGFNNVFATSALSSVMALLLLAFYSKKEAELI
ncbi:MAG: MFS transporter, partial [Firmicutes bacterium]|nr:MFS transporter [Bacillota bacterium]